MERAKSGIMLGESPALRCAPCGHALVSFTYQSAIWLPVQNTTSFFAAIISIAARKYGAVRCAEDCRGAAQRHHARAIGGIGVEICSNWSRARSKYSDACDAG